MKGLVFTEFVEWIEQTWTSTLADDVLDAATLASGGAYTSVGTYSHAELIELVGHLAQRTGQPAATLVKQFGRALFARLAMGHPNVLVDASSAFALLARLEDHIHPEVRKLYPDAQVPSFDTRSDGADLVLVYSSRRPFADLAEGLILGCGDWFDEALVVYREDLADRTLFRVQRTQRV